jgi:hypothetical protein
MFLTGADAGAFSAMLETALLLSIGARTDDPEKAVQETICPGSSATCFASSST